MSVGFEFFETMSGSYALVDAPNDLRAISFSVRASAPSVAHHVGDRMTAIEGAVDVEGLAKFRPLHGTLRIDPLIGKKLVYDFTFPDDADRTLHFHGQKTVRFAHLLATMTTLPGELRDEAGALLATARLRFDARSDLGRWLKSWRLV